MTLEEKIRQQKGIFSSGKAFNLGLSKIGKTVFYCVNHHAIGSQQVKQAKGETACTALSKKIAAANNIKALEKLPINSLLLN